MSQADLEIGFIIGTHYGSRTDLSAAIKAGRVSADTILNLLGEAFQAGQENPAKPVEPLADWEKELLAIPTAQPIKDPKDRQPGDILIFHTEFPLGNPAFNFHKGDEVKVAAVEQTSRGWSYWVARFDHRTFATYGNRYLVSSECFENN